MSWFGLHRAPTAEPPPAARDLELPLFPVKGVLFPGGLLTLKVFEQRYLDMAARCLRERSSFGLCLIQSGAEVGPPATPHSVGTLAHILEADMPELGILMLKLRGGERFRIHSHEADSTGLIRARVESIPEPAPQAVPAALGSLLPLLQRIASELGPTKIAEPHAFDDATWVGYRLCEIVPVQPLAKQKLLELDDPISRLEILHTYLSQRRLIG